MTTTSKFYLLVTLGDIYHTPQSIRKTSQTQKHEEHKYKTGRKDGIVQGHMQVRQAC